jgi:hypothetical protein
VFSVGVAARSRSYCAICAGSSASSCSRDSPLAEGPWHGRQDIPLDADPLRELDLKQLLTREPVQKRWLIVGAAKR